MELSNAWQSVASARSSGAVGTAMERVFWVGLDSVVGDVARAADCSFKNRTELAMSSGVASLHKTARHALLTRTVGSAPASRAIFVARMAD